MVNNSVWEKVSAIAKDHCSYSVHVFCNKPGISRESDVRRDLGLQGELATDFFEDITTAFPKFELSDGKGDFNIDRYFLSEVSQSAIRSLLYIFYPKLKALDRTEKRPITLGMLEDAILRGYWNSERYLGKWK